MGNEQRTRLANDEAQAQVDRIREMLIGDLREHGAFDRGCPKCGAKPDFPSADASWRPAKRWCSGHIAMLPSEIQQPCKANGEHLHGQCPACSYGWREACAPESSGAASD